MKGNHSFLCILFIFFFIYSNNGGNADTIECKEKCDSGSNISTIGDKYWILKSNIFHIIMVMVVISPFILLCCGKKKKDKERDNDIELQKIKEELKKMEEVDVMLVEKKKGDDEIEGNEKDYDPNDPNNQLNANYRQYENPLTARKRLNENNVNKKKDILFNNVHNVHNNPNGNRAKSIRIDLDMDINFFEESGDTKPITPKTIKLVTDTIEKYNQKRTTMLRSSNIDEEDDQFPTPPQTVVEPRKRQHPELRDFLDQFESIGSTPDIFASDQNIYIPPLDIGTINTSNLELDEDKMRKNNIVPPPPVKELLKSNRVRSTRNPYAINQEELSPGKKKLMKSSPNVSDKLSPRKSPLNSPNNKVSNSNIGSPKNVVNSPKNLSNDKILVDSPRVNNLMKSVLVSNQTTNILNKSDGTNLSKDILQKVMHSPRISQHIYSLHNESSADLPTPLESEEDLVNKRITNISKRQYLLNRMSSGLPSPFESEEDLINKVVYLNRSSSNKNLKRENVKLSHFSSSNSKLNQDVLPSLEKHSSGLPQAPSDNDSLNNSKKDILPENIPSDEELANGNEDSHSNEDSKIPYPSLGKLKQKTRASLLPTKLESEELDRHINNIKKFSNLNSKVGSLPAALQILKMKYPHMMESGNEERSPNRKGTGNIVRDQSFDQLPAPLDSEEDTKLSPKTKTLVPPLLLSQMSGSMDIVEKMQMVSPKGDTNSDRLPRNIVSPLLKQPSFMTPNQNSRNVPTYNINSPTNKTNSPLSPKAPVNNTSGVGGINGNGVNNPPIFPKNIPPPFKQNNVNNLNKNLNNNTLPPLKTNPNKSPPNNNLNNPVKNPPIGPNKNNNNNNNKNNNNMVPKLNLGNVEPKSSFNDNTPLSPNSKSKLIIIKTSPRGLTSPRDNTKNVRESPRGTNPPPLLSGFNGHSNDLNQRLTPKEKRESLLLDHLPIDVDDDGPPPLISGTNKELAQNLKSPRQNSLEKRFSPREKRESLLPDPLQSESEEGPPPLMGGISKELIRRLTPLNSPHRERGEGDPKKKEIPLFFDRDLVLPPPFFDKNNFDGVDKSSPRSRREKHESLLPEPLASEDDDGPPPLMGNSEKKAKRESLLPEPLASEDDEVYTDNNNSSIYSSPFQTFSPIKLKTNNISGLPEPFYSEEEENVPMNGNSNHLSHKSSMKRTSNLPEPLMSGDSEDYPILTNGVNISPPNNVKNNLFRITFDHNNNNSNSNNQNNVKYNNNEDDIPAYNSQEEDSYN